MGNFDTDGTRKVDFKTFCQATKFVYDQFGLHGGVRATERMCDHYSPDWKIKGRAVDAYVGYEEFGVQQYNTIRGDRHRAGFRVYNEDMFFHRRGNEYGLSNYFGRWIVEHIVFDFAEKKSDPFSDGVRVMYDCLKDGGRMRKCQKSNDVLDGVATSMKGEIELYERKIKDATGLGGYRQTEQEILVERSSRRRSLKLIELYRGALRKAMTLYYKEQTAEVREGIKDLLGKIKARNSRSYERARLVVDGMDRKVGNFRGGAYERIEGEFLLTKGAVSQLTVIFNNIPKPPKSTPVWGGNHGREFGVGVGAMHDN